jgi:uncharacterized protein (TIGR02246 family)
MLRWLLALALTADPMLETAPGDIAPASTPTFTQQQVDVQAITKVLNDQYAAWNRQDLEGYLNSFWNSPNLLFVTDGQVLLGWAEVKAMIGRYYTDRNAMGVATPERVQVNMISGDSATTVDWWTVQFKTVNVHGISTSSWRKFPEGWRIIETHTSSSEFPK